MTPWSNKQLAAALSITVQRISQLCKTGILPAPVKGRHDPFKAVPAYLRFLEKRLTGNDLKAARIAKYAVETALKELELRQKSGELILRDAVEKEWFRLGRTMRDTMQNIPPRVSSLCAAEKNQDKVFALLTKEIDQCLEGLSNGTPNGASPSA